MAEPQGMLDFMTSERDDAKMILVPEGYLAFLHDELSENRARLKELLGESQADAVLSWCADRFVRTERLGRYSSSPAEGLVQKLSSFGIAATWRENGDVVTFEVRCPFARRVHPLTSSREPRCPLGEYVLGAVRLEDPKAQLVHNDLTGDGARFTLRGDRPRGEGP